jgi:large subunit ribosomal protein L23
MRVQEIIRRPLITEKSTALRESHKIVAFAVDPGANKRQIKQAVEAQFKGTEVAEVRVARMHGKVRRRGRSSGRQPDWKKAYVRLTPESKPIDFFEGI